MSAGASIVKNSAMRFCKLFIETNHALTFYRMIDSETDALIISAVAGTNDIVGPVLFTSDPEAHKNCTGLPQLITSSSAYVGKMHRGLLGLNFTVQDSLAEDVCSLRYIKYT